MAEQIPYSIAETLLLKLSSTVFEEIGLMYGVREQLGTLNNTLSTVRDVLLDAEEKQQEQGHAVAGWIRRLKDVVYDADDLLDDFLTEDLRRKTDDRSRFVRQVSDFFSSSNHLVFRFRMGHRMKAITGTLNGIANDINNFGLLVNQASDVRVRNGGRETCSVVGRSHEIVGRDGNKKEIIELLMQSSSQENLSVVMIMGIGGLGKTTLAQLVYNDQQVVGYFKMRMWVCVSDDFNTRTLIRNIIKSATNKDVENLELDQLVILLKEILDGKLYLLVLDDVWKEDKTSWREFKNLLPVGANGSKILVTTRSRTVALAAEIDSPYVLEGLKEDESWHLFESLAFRNREEERRPNLVAIGKDIVKMCSGVPLVIETLGSMLCFETRESKWRSIKNNKNLLMLKEGNNILSVLRLSYDSLPTHLKQCFAYCALFPKDYRIGKELLVQLWMAQGYLQGSPEDMDLEEDGNDYFEDLLSRSLFVEIEKDKVNNDILSCKMHDLIHDLAQSIVKSEIHILTNDENVIPGTIHHISSFEFSNFKRIKDLRGKSIRTLFLDWVGIDDWNERSLSSLKYVRVLKVRFQPQEKILTNWSKLSHLRFLDLSYIRFERLPNGITRLKHLQTLKLLRCSVFKEWPKDVKKLINLRHLEIDDYCEELRYMPRGLGELTQLKTLPIYKVGKGGGLSELKSLNNLRGQLHIEWYSDRTRGAIEAKEGILAGKRHLERLRLQGLEKQGNEEEVSIMESLKPHPNLKELSIVDYGGERFPNWMMNDGLHLLLPNLVNIQMKSCKKIQVLPPFGQLPSLKLLDLRNFEAAEYMKDYPSSSASFFPSLKTLNLRYFDKLEGWSGRRDAMMYVEDLQLARIRAELYMHLMSISSSSLLKHLSIKEMEDLISLPEGLRHASTLQTLKIRWCSALTTLPPWIGNLTSLTKLEIGVCQQLTSLPQEMQSLCHLQSLSIYNCPNLTLRREKEMGEDGPLISHIPHMNIQDLSLINTKAELCMHLISLSSSSLKSLTIERIEDLISLPEGLQHASALQTLQIVRCPALMTLPPWIGYLTSLTELESKGCQQLTSLPQEMQSLCHLQSLRIHDCPNLTLRREKEMGEDGPLISHIPRMNIQDLDLRNTKAELCMHLISISSSSLKSLTIERIEDLISLPEGLQHASALQTLKIVRCPALMTLPPWIGYLTSLVWLDIFVCQQLISLPQEMQSLHHLHGLEIKGCPNLTPRCQKETGEDWHLISHIPNIIIED